MQKHTSSPAVSYKTLDEAPLASDSQDDDLAPPVHCNIMAGPEGVVVPGSEQDVLCLEACQGHQRLGVGLKGHTWQQQQQQSGRGRAAAGRQQQGSSSSWAAEPLVQYCMTNCCQAAAGWRMWCVASRWGPFTEHHTSIPTAMQPIGHPGPRFTHPLAPSQTHSISHALTHSPTWAIADTHTHTL